jgi:oleandomycin transport system ATP-binding protein
VQDLVGDAPEMEGPRVTAPVTDPALLPAAVRRLDDAGVVIAELTLRNSSLNEVFLSLTGHRAGDGATESVSTEGALA